MHTMAAAQFPAVGTADILINDFISRWDCPKSLFSDYGKQLSSDRLRALHKSMRMRKLVTSANHPMGDGGTERMSHTMAQLLSMLVNERQNDWKHQLSLLKRSFQIFSQHSNRVDPEGGALVKVAALTDHRHGASWCEWPSES